MTVLAEILSSRIRAEILRLLFDGREDELYVREIERQSGFSVKAVRQVLSKLKRLDLVLSRRDGNRLYYKANAGHPLYSDLRSMAAKTVALVPRIAGALEGATVDVAFVFGSLASKTERAGSDVDLMVIGNMGLRELSSRLSGVSEQIGREINPHVMTRAEYRKRLKKKDHFVSQVIQGPKLFIKGVEDDLEAMGE